jgi:hypothetical protein
MRTAKQAADSPMAYAPQAFQGHSCSDRHARIGKRIFHGHSDRHCIVGREARHQAVKRRQLGASDGAPHPRSCVRLDEL